MWKCKVDNMTLSNKKGERCPAKAGGEEGVIIHACVYAYIYIYIIETAINP